MKDIYFKGSLIGGGQAPGGIIGELNATINSIIELDSNYWKGTTTLSCAYNYICTSAQARGLTDIESKQLASYSGWDISNQLTGSSIWYINEGVSTPVLRALMTP